MTFDSRPPCQASGELPSSSTTSRPARQQLGVGLAERERVAGVGLVAAGDDDRRALDLLERVQVRERRASAARPRSASATASRCSWRARRWRSARRDRRRATRAGMPLHAEGRDEALDRRPSRSAVAERVPARQPRRRRRTRPGRRPA